jgi:hypothetical protein
LKGILRPFANIGRKEENFMSTVLREIIKKALEAWENIAKTTPTPIDDFIVSLIRAILGL